MSWFRAACLILSICLLVLGIGCTSTDDPLEPEPPVPTELSGIVGAGGGTLISDDGFLSITIPAGALSVDTEIRLKEIDPSEMDPAFGDFAARKGLLLEPADLNFAIPAEVTYRMSISVRTGIMSQKLPAQDDPEEAEFIIGAVKTPEGVKIPNQRTKYNLNPGAEKNVETTIEVDNGSLMYLASPLDSMGSFGQFAGILGPDPVVPFYKDMTSSLMTYLTVPDESVIKLNETTFESDPLMINVTPLLADGDPWSPVDTIVVGNGRVMLLFTIDVIPEQEGMTDFAVQLCGELELIEPGQTGLPLGDDPDVGKLDFEIKMPTLREWVEMITQNDLTIQTGMTSLKDLAVAFGTIDDPAPMGNPYHSWLYVAGAEAIHYYRLVENEGLILSAEYVNSIPVINMEGVVPVSTGNPPDMVRDLWMYGPTGNITGWDPDSDDYGMIGMLCDDRVYDAVGYGGETHTLGLSMGRGYGAYFIEYNPITNMYNWPMPPGGPLPGHLFPGDGGPIVSCFVDEETNAALVIKDGLPGEIWYHSRLDLNEEGSLLGHTGNEPQQLRGAGAFCAISNYISNTLTTFTWTGGSSISNVTSTPVGLGPQGIDVMLLGDATPIVVSTGLDGHFTISHFSITGDHLKSVTYDVPSTCTGPRYAVFIGRDPLIYVALSCHDSGTVELIVVNVDDLQ